MTAREIAGRAAEFFGLKRSIVGLLSMVVLLGLGEKMAERFLPIYILALGGGPVAIGLLNGMDNLLSALYSFPGAWLSERFGAKRALLLFNLLAILGYAIVIAIPDWRAVLVGSVFFLSWTAISLPASMSLVSRVLPKNKRTMGVSTHSLVRRLPMALGPIIGGAFIGAYGRELGVRLAFGVATAMALLSMLVQSRMIEDDAPKPGEAGGAGGRGADMGPLAMLRELSPSLRRLLVSDILIRFCEQIPYAFVVVWAMGEGHGSPSVRHPVTAMQFGYLTAIEMVTAMLVYIPVAYLADRSAKKPFVLITFVNFTVFPLTLLWAQSFWGLAAAFVVRGLKEFGEPTRKALILDLAPEDRKAAAFGAYYLARDVVVSLAAFGGAYLWMISPQTNFIAASAFGAAGTAWFAWKGEDLGPPTPDATVADA